MLDNLVKCIETLKSRMENHAASLQANEWRTRTQLIDPMLCVLGWDVSDPELVTPEYNTGGKKRADYALLNADKTPLVVLETKTLNVTLTEDHREQMVNYAVGKGILYAGLASGNKWELYDVFQPVALDKKRILDLSIEADPPHVCAIKLLLLWQPILSGGFIAETTAALEQVEKIVAVNGDPPSPDPPPMEDWVPLTKYDPPPGSPPPESIRFWDGKEQPIKYWNEVLVSTAKKLYVEGILKATDTPIQLWSDAWNSIHSEPVHPNGTKFRKPLKPIGTPPLYVQVNMNSSDIRGTTVLLLKKYKVDPARVYLERSSQTA